MVVVCCVWLLCVVYGCVVWCLLCIVCGCEVLICLPTSCYGLVLWLEGIVSQCEAGVIHPFQDLIALPTEAVLYNNDYLSDKKKSTQMTEID